MTRGAAVQRAHREAPARQRGRAKLGRPVFSARPVCRPINISVWDTLANKEINCDSYRAGIADFDYLLIASELLVAGEAVIFGPDLLKTPSFIFQAMDLSGAV